jgi:succinyl-diaminopimelate desuccinylase
LTCDLIRFKSTTLESINQAAQFCAEWLERRGGSVELYENKGLKVVTASIGSGDKTIILNGHLDVVPGLPSQFEPRIEQGKIFGRGSADMLGAVATMMEVMSELTIRPPNCRVILCLVPDEESGGQKGSGFLVDQNIVGDFVICGEPTNLDIALQAKGVLQLHIEVEGVSAHGSRPWLGRNAILQALRDYQKIESLEFLKESSEFFTRPSFNISRIQAGQAFNQVPSYCSFGLDIRYLPEQNPEEILHAIRKAAPETKISILMQGPPVLTDKKEIYVNVLKASAEKVLSSTVNFFGQDGSADTRFYAVRGIPAVEFGPRGGGHHGPEEYVDIESLYEYKKILKDFIQNLKKGV